MSFRGKFINDTYAGKIDRFGVCNRVLSREEMDAISRRRTAGRRRHRGILGYHQRLYGKRYRHVSTGYRAEWAHRQRDKSSRARPHWMELVRQERLLPAFARRIWRHRISPRGDYRLPVGRDEDDANPSKPEERRLRDKAERRGMASAWARSTSFSSFDPQDRKRSSASSCRPRATWPTPTKS